MARKTATRKDKALGAAPFDYARTAQRLRDLVEILLEDALCVNGRCTEGSSLSRFEEAVNGTIPEPRRRYAQQCLATLDAFLPRSPVAEIWTAWQQDLDAFVRALERLQDDVSIERAMLAAGLPRFCALSELTLAAGSIRRDLDERAARHAERRCSKAWVAAKSATLRGAGPEPRVHRDAYHSGRIAPGRQRRWEIDVLDSYSTTLGLLAELHQYGERLTYMLRHELEVDPFATIPARPQASLEYLAALLELRLMLDVQRWHRLKVDGHLDQSPYQQQAELFETDGLLRVAFTRVVQRLPMYAGATPNFGDHQYGRTEHFAQRLVIERCNRIFFPSASPPRQPEEERPHGLEPLPPRDAIWSAGDFTVERSLLRRRWRYSTTPSSPSRRDRAAQCV